MPGMVINVEGEGGAYETIFKRYRNTVELPHDIPVRVETLDNGMTSGAPSIGFIIELPKPGLVVIAQTSVKLFQMCAFVTLSKYGDLTEGSVLGTFTQGGTANLTLSTAAACPACNRQIPGSCKFCPECGAKT
jgi:hypothetical protein